MSKKKTDKTTAIDITQQTSGLSGMYQNWFLDYASYVILDRAVPKGRDGLKPVQRRILHALKTMDDGRFHKVANVVGQTMQFHPHGDASIYEALVNMGQKNLLIDTQGNWGDSRTGDKAAAARYIEARLTKFALAVAFNKENTEWQLTYDGRKQEPVELPLKFPLLLAQGVEGIAVGLSTKILPHNFIELLKASISILKGRTPKIYPDFLTGGLADVSNYDQGHRGGKVKVRAKLEVKDKRTILIKELPYGVTTSSMIDSIIKANDKGKIKIKKVTDNTAKDVEIQIDLHPDVSPDVSIDALYAFTNCEVSISPNCCVVVDNTPLFLRVNDLLKLNTEHTKQLLKQELENQLNALQEKLHFASLEQIFIENRIYRRIEECETFEAVIEEIDKGLEPFKAQFVREVTRDDILRLTEIRIKRISKYDTFKAQDQIRQLKEDIEQVKHHLAHLTEYAIDYFQNLIDKFGKGRERKTELTDFDEIKVKQVVVANQKLYVNKAEGFVGYGMKKDEYVSDCSDIDDIIVFRKDGKFMVSKVGDKKFMGKDILHVAVWRKGDERTTYHLVYTDGRAANDGKAGKTYVKRFNVKAITRDKEYDLTQGTKYTKVHYFSAHPNGESEVLHYSLHPSCRAKIKTLEFDFSELDIKGRSSKGNIMTRYPVRRVEQKSVGTSTIGGRKIWLDEAVGRLNTNERGRFLGEFDTGNSIAVLYQDGELELTNFELTNRYDMKKVAAIEKFNAETIWSVIYYHSQRERYFVKRFKIETSKEGQLYPFLDPEGNCKLFYASSKKDQAVMCKVQAKRGAPREEERIDVDTFIDVKGWKSLGNQFRTYKLFKVTPIIETDGDEASASGASLKEVKKNIPLEIKKPTKTTSSSKPSARTENKSDGVKLGDTIEFDLKPSDKKKKTDNNTDQGTLF